MGTILVVDDSRMMRRLVGEALRSAGFTVVEAADGALALEQIKATPEVQLVVCDINMPNMNGIEFLEALRKPPFESQVPVMILTTPGQLELVSQARELGARRWLLKPFQPAQLIEMAQQLTEPTRAAV